MAQNKLIDLNNHLFAQLERLNDENITDSTALEQEFKKAKAISQISGQILKSAALTLQASRFAYQGEVKDLPEQFGVKKIEGVGL